MSPSTCDWTQAAAAHLRVWEPIAQANLAAGPRPPLSRTPGRGGEYLLTGSRGLLVYWAIWFTAANLFVIGYEEPTLRRRFGGSYDRYAKEVGRWLPRSSAPR
jgi:protein-S-isoprenylcysteine O-methyltransferase Ste14